MNKLPFEQIQREILTKEEYKNYLIPIENYKQEVKNE